MHIQMLLPLDRYVLTTHDSYYKAHLAVFPTTIKETQVMLWSCGVVGRGSSGMRTGSVTAGMKILNSYNRVSGSLFKTICLFTVGSIVIL